MEINLIFGVITLILSVVIHEVAHGYAAQMQGDPTARLQGRLTLNPLKHLDPFGSVILPALLALTNAGFIFGWAKPVPYNPYNLRNQRWGEAIVAAAGPLSNLVIAAVFGFVLRFLGPSGLLSQSLFEIMTMIVFINILLAIFNLVPIPPLDGSKILSSILPYRFQHWRAKMEQYGFILVVLFILFFWQLVSPVVFMLFRLITGL